jgi:hypothetical protein
METDDVPVYLDRVEKCTCCGELFPWTLLDVMLSPQERILILCSYCKGKLGD